MKAVLVEKKIEAAGVKTFIFKPEKEFSFEAGQFAFFNFRLDGKEYSKHFTISNSPTRENIELTTIVGNSDYKKALDSLEKEHEIEIAGPMGEFTLKKSSDKQIVFLVGGIGITPVRSMLEYLADKKMDRKIILFYSNRTLERIAFRQELEEPKQKIHGLKIVHALAELDEKQEAQWDGETGFISKAMIERHAANLNDTVFFVVGPPTFIEAMKKMLEKELKVQGKRIVLETFSGY